MVHSELHFVAIHLPTLFFFALLISGDVCDGGNATVAADNATDCQGIPFHLKLPTLRPAAQNSNLTVVLMNWQRPTLLRELLGRLVNYSNVDAILVMQCHSDTKLKYTHGKVRLVDAVHLNNAFSMTSRFIGCLMTPNEWCLVMDDDILLSEEAIERLREAKAQEPDRLHGYYGRNYNTSLVYSYHNAKPGPAKIVLTKAAIYDTRFCEAFFRLSPLVADVAEAVTPWWNGEDIFMSLAARAVTGLMGNLLPRRKELREVMGVVTSNGISKDRSHLKWRNLMLRAGHRRLTCLGAKL